MGKLDSLKISDCPYAFASFAAKHNALVDMLAGMVGQNGISVVLAEKNAIIRGAGGAGGNVTIDNVATANVVGAGGYLANAYVANANIGTFPTALRVLHVASGTYMEIAAPGDLPGIRLVGTHALEILESDLTADMAIREIDVCSGNVAMKMLVIASAPYV
jgi:hypothetical protein